MSDDKLTSDQSENLARRDDSSPEAPSPQDEWMNKVDAEPLASEELASPFAEPARTCPSCGARLESGAQFCTECGTKLDASPGDEEGVAASEAPAGLADDEQPATSEQPPQAASSVEASQQPTVYSWSEEDDSSEGDELEEGDASNDSDAPELPATTSLAAPAPSEQQAAEVLTSAEAPHAPAEPGEQPGNALASPVQDAGGDAGGDAGVTQVLPSRQQPNDAPNNQQGNPDTPVVETASATTDRAAARATNGKAFAIAGGIMGGVLLLSMAMSSCTTTALNIAAQQIRNDSYDKDYGNNYVYDDYGNRDYGDNYVNEFMNMLNQNNPYGTNTPNGLNGTTNDTSNDKKDTNKSYTTKDVFDADNLVLFDGYHLEMSASDYAGVQEPIKTFVQSMVKADQDGMKNVIAHLRVANAEGSSLPDELAAAIAAAEEALKSLDGIAVPAEAQLEGTTSASASRIARDATTAAGSMTKRWEAVIAELKAIQEPLETLKDLEDLDEDMYEKLEDADNDMMGLLGEA